MKIKQWLTTSVLLAGVSMATKAQNAPTDIIQADNSMVNITTYKNTVPQQYRDLIFSAGLYTFKHKTIGGALPEKEILALRRDSALMSIPLRVVGGVNADSIIAKTILKSTGGIVCTYVKTDSLVATKFNINGLSASGGNLGVGTLAETAGASTNAADPDIDRLSVDGSIIASLSPGLPSSAASYRMLKLHNTKTAITDSWHIGFSANTNSNGTGYQELVQLRTRKTASGTVFAIASEASGVMTDRMKVLQNGNVAIGLDTAVEKLAVNGRVKATGFVTDASSFPDYVFAPSYELRSIDALAGYVREHRKLPGMPSEKEVLGKGLNLAEVSVSTVEKVEELSLYIIQLNERIKQLEAKLAAGK